MFNKKDMTQIKKVKTSEGVQFYPQTHTKAVIDDNGYTAESRLKAMQDEINAKQLEVGAVPSDLTPTENSSNWVTSGGVYNAMQVVQSELTELEWEKVDFESVFEGYSWDLSNGGDFAWALGSIHHDDGKAWSSSSYYHLYIPVDSIQGRTVELKAQASHSTSCAFLNRVGFSYTSSGVDISSYYSNGYTVPIVIAADEKVRFVIPDDCNYLYIECGQTSGDIRVPESNIYYLPKWLSDAVDMIKADGANIFNLDEKTIGIYKSTDIWTPSLSGNTATWTVATKKDTVYRLYISPVILTENKKYHITFDYVNQTASAVTPMLRTSEDVYIDVMDSIPVGSGTYDVEIISTANVGILAFNANANVVVGSIFSISNIEIREIKNIADLTEDCVNSIESINDEISEINGILKPSGVVILEQGLWQNGEKANPSKTTSKRIRTNDLLKCPLSLSVNSGYNILRLERFDEDKNLVSSDWVSSGRTEVELKDLGYATFTINNTSDTAISPSENIISDYTAGLEMLLKSDVISTDSFDMPLLGYGRKVISRPTETYCHNSIVRETPEYIFVCYQSSTETTYEDSQNHFQHILLSINKRSGKKRYVTLFADADAETIGGNTISYVYNQSICQLSNTTLLIRTGCNLNDKWQLIYKVYDATADTLTDAAVSQISYNGSTVDFTCANYMTMCNTLYNTEETVIEKPYTMDIAGMWKQGDTIYTLMALKNAWVLMTSTDGITWSPVACPYVKVPSETEICVYNSKIYYACRSEELSQVGYFVTDLSGTVLKEWTVVSNIKTKPYITACDGRVFIMYNISSGVSKFHGRNKVQFAEVNTSTYALTNIRTYASRNGYNYYCIAPTTTENLIFVNVEDCRGLNYSANRNCTNDVNIAYIELLE